MAEMALVYYSNNIRLNIRNSERNGWAYMIFMTPNLVLQTSFILQKSTCASRARSHSIFAAQIRTIFPFCKAKTLVTNEMSKKNKRQDGRGKKREPPIETAMRREKKINNIRNRDLFKWLRANRSRLFEQSRRCRRCWNCWEIYVFGLVQVNIRLAIHTYRRH